jgi:MoaA/NifB/PqqE/SkfB family radical SAM enzyme
MYKSDEITTVHLEVTERCNASCPQCARNLNGGDVNPQLHDAELSLADVQQILKPEFIRQLKRLYMCGNYGDPISARDTLEIFEYIRSNNDKMQLSFHTNASAKTPEWWSRLPAAMGKSHYVVFSVDGLEDTNHLYRQGTVWRKIMENARAFIAAGGRARWDYIVFAHNEHQVEEARALADSMGFEKFNVKKSNRFFSNTRGAVKTEHQAGNRRGAATTVISMPTNPEYQNAAIKGMQEISKDKAKIELDLLTTVADLAERKLGPQRFNLEPALKKDMEKYWDTAEIKCKVAEEKSVYITAEGYLQPCCWTAGQMYVWYWKERGGQIWNAIDAAGLDTLDLRVHDIGDVINGKFMQEVIPDSWTKPSCAEGKLAVCAKTCGTKYDAFSEQFK